MMMIELTDNIGVMSEFNEFEPPLKFFKFGLRISK